MKGSDRLSNFTKRESIKYDSKTVSDVNMVPVSYEFIDIKGLEFEKEDFITNQKRIQEQM
jgi:predicted nuclease of restriction endonuclease-like (RecB) superfamily